MNSWILRIVLGVIVFFFSTPSVMAKEAIAGEVRQDEFVAEVDDNDRSTTALAMDEAVLSLGAESLTESEESVDGGRQVKRTSKRSSSGARSASRFMILCSLSAERVSEGIARQSVMRDARQERTSTIRFLQIQALVC